MYTLWNLIRDFFVRYIFGGVSYDGTYYAENAIGLVGVNSEDTIFAYEPNSSDFGVYVGNSLLFADDLNGSTYISIGDWLSTTATIITLVALFIAITMLMISLFKWIVRLVSLRG